MRWRENKYNPSNALKTMHCFDAYFWRLLQKQIKRMHEIRNNNNEKLTENQTKQTLEQLQIKSENKRTSLNVEAFVK